MEQVASTLEKISESINVMADELNNFAVKVKPPFWITELVLGFSNKKTGRPLPLASDSVVQTVFAPRREHSRRPDEVAEWIEALYPNARKLEMFARETRLGWDAFGNEFGKFG